LSRPPSLSPPGPTVALKKSRPLPSASSRYRKNSPPRRAPGQPPSPTETPSPLPKRSSRSPRTPAIGHTATLGTVIFASAASQPLRGPTANVIEPGPTWHRGLVAGMVPASDSSRIGVNRARNRHLRTVALRSPARFLLPAPRGRRRSCLIARATFSVVHRRPLDREASPC